ncbi:MAG: DUF2891 domain-containing protein [Candidatus Aminicenantes bacterium]|nr:DUF2891 domain-containing protein [Candidatus Aminicenantes bacterium]
MKKRVAIVLILGIMLITGGKIFSTPVNDNSWQMPEFSEELALKFAEMALNCIEKEYPNKPSHVFNDEKDLKLPREQHPAFYGCFDWHSSVHGHWMLVRVLKIYPEIGIRGKIIAALKRNITPEKIAAEVEYLNQKSRKSFERTYGWSWLLKLTEELYTWDDPDGKSMFIIISPLADKIVSNYLNFLPKQTYPIRTGVHPNTAFGLLFAYDYGKTLKHKKLLEIVVTRSREYFGNDMNCPDSWEPGGEDFFSPCLMETLLMTRVLKPEEFVKWFKNFFPDIRNSNLLIPAIVSDRTDGKLSHLDGLNLSRVWSFSAILKAIHTGDPLKGVLEDALKLHLKTAMENIRSGYYEGEHWLGSFAVYAYSEL